VCDNIIGYVQVSGFIVVIGFIGFIRESEAWVCHSKADQVTGQEGDLLIIAAMQGRLRAVLGSVSTIGA